jgi:hypothetical protein
MSGLKELIPDRALHERRIEVRTYALEGDRLIAEGRLRDEQLVPTFEIDNSPKEPGIVHHMCIRLLLGGWPLVILDAEAEMPEVPHALCPSTLDSVGRVVGMPITSGFMEKVRRRIGGVRGCAHLTYLLTAMATAAVHGYWCKKTREPRPERSRLEDYPEISSLVNTCKLWEEDGPLIRTARELLDP